MKPSILTIGSLVFYLSLITGLPHRHGGWGGGSFGGGWSGGYGGGWGGHHRGGGGSISTGSQYPEFVSFKCIKFYHTR